MKKYIGNYVSKITINMIFSEQHGLLKGKSCSTELTDVQSDISSCLDS